MYSQEVIDRFKEKIHLLKDICDYRIYGITHVDIKCDGFVKQIVLLFERLRVDEPVTFLTRETLYADVYIRIDDELLLDIASKKVSLDDAINGKMFFAAAISKDILMRQMDGLRKILPHEHFTSRSQMLMQKEFEKKWRNLQTGERFKDAIDFGYSSSRSDLSAVPMELQFLADHVEYLHKKYDFKRPTDKQ